MTTSQLIHPLILNIFIVNKGRTLARVLNYFASLTLGIALRAQPRAILVLHFQCSGINGVSFF